MSHSSENEEKESAVVLNKFSELKTNNLNGGSDPTGKSSKI